MEKRISGMMIYYYFVCKRKLRYFSHEIRMEQDNESVMIGKIIDENSYSRNDKHINIDNVINIDYISEKKILHEVKKSRSIEQAGIWQVKYYLYYLRQKGIKDITGQIDYPLLHQKINVELFDDDVKKLEEIIGDISIINELPKPPDLDVKSICKKCAYADLCLI